MVEGAANGKSVLIVEDDDEVARRLCSTVARHAQVVRASSITEALKAIEDSPPTRWLAAILDVGLPDGSGLAVARELRTKCPKLLVIILTGYLDHEIVNTAYTLRVQYAHKPIEMSWIDAMIGQEAGELTGLRVADAAARMVERAKLTKQQAAIVHMIAEGIGRDAILAHLGIKRSTFKTIVNRLLKKTGSGDLARLREQILDEALELANADAMQREPAR